MGRKQKSDAVPAEDDVKTEDLSLSKKRKKRKSSKIEDVQTSVKKDKRRKKSIDAQESLDNENEKTIKPETNGHVTASPCQSVSSAKSFPLATAVQLPAISELMSQSNEQQLSCFSQLGTTCERILRLMDDVQATCGLWREQKKIARDADEASAVLEDSIVADMAKLKGVPMARHFAEMTLWKRLKRFTDSEVTYIETLRRDEKSTDDLSKDDEMPTESSGKPDAVQSEEYISLKTNHLKHLTSEYAEDLEKIRDAESLDVVGVQTLLKCLDESAALYAAAMTFKKS